MLERSDGATHFQDRSWPRSVSFHNHAPHDVCFRGATLLFPSVRTVSQIL